MGFGDFVRGFADSQAVNAVRGKHRARLDAFKRSMLDSLSFEQLKRVAGYFGVFPKEDSLVSLNRAFGDKPAPVFVAQKADFIRTIMGSVSDEDLIAFFEKEKWAQVVFMVEGRAEYLKRNNIDAKGNSLGVVI